MPIVKNPPGRLTGLPLPPGDGRGMPMSAAPDGEPELVDLTLDLVYERHAEAVAGWARRLAGPGADLEDLLHEVFLIALRRYDEFRGQATMRTWLFRITWQVVRGRRRRDRLRRWLFARYAPVELDDVPPVTPLEHVERNERIARLYQALDQLPENDRAALVLFEIEGLPGDEIATLLDIEVNALWVRLHRARQRLSKMLAKEETRRSARAPKEAR